LLHDEIERQLLQGKETLLQGDKSLVEYNILHLLQQSLAYKKGWLARVWAARQRAQRIAAQDNELIVQSKEASLIYLWMKTHKDRPKRARRTATYEISDDQAVNMTPLQEAFISDAEYLASSAQEANIQHPNGVDLAQQMPMPPQALRMCPQNPPRRSQQHLDHHHPDQTDQCKKVQCHRVGTGAKPWLQGLRLPAP
jgi:hypothetical protein